MERNGELPVIVRMSAAAVVTATQRPALTVPVKIAIAVTVVLVVLAVVAFLVYWFVFHNKSSSSSSGGSGTTKFGDIKIVDTSTRAAGNNFAPGDKLQLSYIPSTTGFSGRSVWKLSTDGGKTFSVNISDPSYGNVVQWTIPANIFTNQAVFRVQDAQQAQDFVSTTTPLAIQPVFTLQTGPGLAHDGDVLYQNSAVHCTVLTDTGLTGLSEKSFQVVLSKDPKFLQGVTQATVSAVAIDTAQSTVTITWDEANLLSGVYYRVQTTTLVAQGYPYELSATSPRTVSVVPMAACDAQGGAFALCQLNMVEVSTGKGGNFTPNTEVHLLVAYKGTYQGPTAFSYTIDGGASQAWSATLVSQTSQLLTYAAQLPDQATTKFVVTVTSGSQTLTNPTPFNLVPFLVIQLPSGSSTTYTVTQTCGSFLTQSSTDVLFSPAAYRPTWTVGHANTDGSQPSALIPVESVTYTAGPTAGTTLAHLTWCMKWSDFNVSGSPPGQLTRLLVVSADNGLLQQTASVIFDVMAYKPTWSPLLSGANTIIDIQQTDAVHNYSAGLWGTRPMSPPVPPFGMWPDPAGSNAVYISSAPDNTGAFFYVLGPLVQGDVTAVFPSAPKPVYYPNIITNSYGSLSGGVLYNLVASAEAGFFRLVPVTAPTQPLYAGPADPLNPALYAVNPGVAPTATSDLTWPGQTLPPGA